MNVMLNLIVVVAGVLGAGMAYPQARRIVRTRRFEGVSPVWAGISVASNAWWLAYGIYADVWALIPVSVASLVLYGAICAAIVHDRGRPALARMMVGAVALGLVPLPFLLAGGWPLAGAAIGLCYGLQLLPAVVAAHRSTDLSGISPGTWLMAWAEAALWAAYSIMVLDPALAVGGGAGLLMSTAILVRLAATGHQPMRALDARRLAVAR